jgi:RNA polymerase sigma-70 factor (ECF subfamily)
MNAGSDKLNQLTDISLSSRLADDDLTAFSEIYNIYFKRVFNFTNRFTLSVEDAEEITQDVFLKLWHKRASIDEEKNFSNFLFTIARNLVIDKMRQYVAYEKSLQQIKRLRPIGHLSQNNTEQLVNYYELSGIISKLVDELPSGRRTVFKLNREKGFTYQEIADLLHVSQGTVEKQMSKALRSLTENLKNKYGIMVELVLALPMVLFA